jgi:hypothetical protein
MRNLKLLGEHFASVCQSKPFNKAKQTAAVTSRETIASLKQRHNKALHPTASVPLVPRSTPAAGEILC